MAAVATLIAKALATAGLAMLSEKFVIRVLVLVAEKLAKSTKNDLDDKLVEEMKKSLGEQGKL